VLSDTVGFIRDLPHDLVAAFRATLATAAEADLLLHVVDASHPSRDEQAAAVNAVLEEIGAEHVPQIQVMNKIDAADLAAGIERDQSGIISRVPFERIDGCRLWRTACRSRRAISRRCPVFRCVRRARPRRLTRIPTQSLPASRFFPPKCR
jgi:GTP-binding protein HflX